MNDDTSARALDALISAIASRDPGDFPFVLAGYAATAAALWALGGRRWALVYVALIPFVNWSFSWAPNIALFGSESVKFNPVTIVTGLVLVVRDFAQREMRHKVLVAMAMGAAWSFYYAPANIALASTTAFMIAEVVDWAMFTFTRYRLSTRVMLSSLIAAPVDTTVFLFGAKFLTWPNWAMSVFGKLIGAVFVSGVMRSRGE